MRRSMIAARKTRRYLKVPAGEAAFTPETLTLQGWWRASYAASPWLGQASAGSSGGRDLSEATNPPAAGASLNGYTPADFDGSNDQIVGTSPQTFVSQTAWSAFVLFKADSADVDGGAGLRVINPGLVTSDQGTWGVHYASDGVSLVHYDGANRERVAAANTSNWHLAQAYYDGGTSTLGLRVDSGAWSTLGTVGTGAFGAGALRVGRNYNTGYFNGLIAEVGLATAVLSADDFESIREYINDRYGLTL